jgi:hypothetical protein
MHSPLHNVSAGVSPAASARATSQVAAKPTGGPAFQALLAKLQTKASDLRSSSGDIGDSAQLRGAMEQARTTLLDALSLGDQVLEAFRGTQLATEAKADGAEVAPSGITGNAITQINHGATSPKRTQDPAGSTGDMR